jgi:hypothetical protein
MWAAVAFVPVGITSRVHPVFRFPVPLPLPSTLAPGLDRRIAPYIVPAAVFVALYSFLPHKELRFLLPAAPLLYLTAAHGLAKMYVHAAAVIVLLLLLSLLLCCCCCCCCGSGGDAFTVVMCC